MRTTRPIKKDEELFLHYGYSIVGENTASWYVEQYKQLVKERPEVGRPFEELKAEYEEKKQRAFDRLQKGAKKEQESRMDEGGMMGEGEMDDQEDKELIEFALEWRKLSDNPDSWRKGQGEKTLEDVMKFDNNFHTIWTFFVDFFS